MSISENNIKTLLTHAPYLTYITNVEKTDDLEIFPTLYGQVLPVTEE